jgi:hypothetical protein
MYTPAPSKPSRLPWVLLGMGIVGLVWALVAIGTAVHGVATRDVEPQVVDCSAFAEFVGVPTMPDYMHSATCTYVHGIDTSMTAEFSVWAYQDSVKDWLASVTSSPLSDQGCAKGLWECLGGAPVDIPTDPDAEYITVTYVGIPESSSIAVTMQAFNT